jgi:hypothetical protein
MPPTDANKIIRAVRDRIISPAAGVDALVALGHDREESERALMTLYPELYGRPIEDTREQELYEGGVRRQEEARRRAALAAAGDPTGRSVKVLGSPLDPSPPTDGLVREEDRAAFTEQLASEMPAGGGLEPDRPAPVANGAVSAIEAYGLAPAVTPEQQFYRFSSQFAPTMRRAFYGQEDPLTARFQLRAPTYEGSFGQFLGAYGGGRGFPAAGPYGGGDPVTPYTGTELRGRAEGIAALQSMTEPAFADYVTKPSTYVGDYRTQLGALTPGEMGGYREDYYSGEQAVQNTRNLANLLALQKSGGGQYTGRMQSAMGNLINELHTQYAIQNPETGGNFLDWYLQRTGTGQRLSPTYKYTAPSIA